MFRATCMFFSMSTNLLTEERKTIQNLSHCWITEQHANIMSFLEDYGCFLYSKTCFHLTRKHFGTKEKNAQLRSFASKIFKKSNKYFQTKRKWLARETFISFCNCYNKKQSKNYIICDDDNLRSTRKKLATRINPTFQFIYLCLDIASPLFNF